MTVDCRVCASCEMMVCKGRKVFEEGCSLCRLKSVARASKLMPLCLKEISAITIVPDQ